MIQDLVGVLGLEQIDIMARHMFVLKLPGNIQSEAATGRNGKLVRISLFIIFENTVLLGS